MFRLKIHRFYISEFLGTTKPSQRTASRITASVRGACHLYCKNGLHSCTVQNAERKMPEGSSAHVSKKDHEHGSVLLQFVEKKEQPGQLTVGAKGKLATAVP